MKNKVIWSDSWPDVEAERAEVRVRLDDWEREGFPAELAEAGLNGAAMVMGLYSLAEGGDLNYRGTRSTEMAEKKK